MPSGVRSLSELAAIDAIAFPTEAHREFIDFITRKRRQWSITALLKGSLVKGTAKKYSDVDIILMGRNIPGCFDAMIGGFDRILLSEHFAVSSNYMVVYRNGLAVEYDLRRSVTREDIEKARVLSGIEYPLSDIRRDRLSVASRLCPARSEDYSRLMIAQMCCAKLLCHKDVLARDIYLDRIRLLSGPQESEARLTSSVLQSEPRERFIDRLKRLAFASDECSEEIRAYFQALFADIQSESEAWQTLRTSPGR